MQRACVWSGPRPGCAKARCERSQPSVGGVGKGHLVREVDALDGLIGRIADAAGIHFRLLNRSRGAAVQGPRCQCDRDEYKRAMQAALASYPNLSTLEFAVRDVELDPSTGAVRGILTECGKVLWAPRVVITTGA